MSTTHDTLKSKPEQPDVRGRLLIVRNAAHFLPTSRIELTQAHWLLEPGVTADKLESVLGHQVKHDVPKPGRAVVTKATGYADFAHKAFADRWKLEELARDLEDVNPQAASLAETQLLTGVPQLVRFRDLSLFAEPKPEKSVPSFSPLYGYHEGKSDAIDAYTFAQPSRVVAERIVAVSSEISLDEARSLAQEAITDQGFRESFWEERAREVGATTSAASIGTVALESLGMVPRD